MKIRWFAFYNRVSWIPLSPSTYNVFSKRHRDISAEKGLAACRNPIQQHSLLHVSVDLYSLIFISEGHLPLGTPVCLFREMDLRVFY